MVCRTFSTFAPALPQRAGQAADQDRGMRTLTSAAAQPAPQRSNVLQVVCV